MSHEAYMRRCLELARKGYGRASPNPMVGALVVRGGEVVGEGFHVYQDFHHAEALALRRAGEKCRGADLYVSLEPCSHQGRTPPCVDRILEAGVARVFAAVEDPNPRVSGRGIRRLRQAGVEAEVGLCREEAEAVNEAFFHFMRTGRPLVRLKLAMTMDGRIAARSGDSKWITGAEARREVHRMRYGADAILTGVATVLRDDPSLDVRWEESNPILKCVLDSKLRTPVDARLFESGDRVLLFHASGTQVPEYPETGRCVGVPRGGDGLDWSQVLEELGRLKVLELLVEGGGKVAASALKAGVVSRLAFFYAPKILGGDALPAVAPLGLERLSDSIAADSIEVQRLGDDWVVRGRL